MQLIIEEKEIKDIMLNVIKEVYNRREAVSIFINTAEPSRCNTGYIVGLNDKHLVLLDLSDDDSNGVLMVFPIAMVFRIAVEGELEKSHIIEPEKLHFYYSAFCCDDDNLFVRVCRFAKDINARVWVSFCGNDEIGILGEPIEITKEVVLVQERDDETDSIIGRSYLSLKYIDFIACEF